MRSGPHTHSVHGAPQDRAQSDREGIQEHHGAGDISEQAGRQESLVGRGILD